MKSTLIKILPLAVALTASVWTFAADESTSVETKKPASAAAIDETKLSPASLKVARLLQSGMDEKVVVAYVKNNPAANPPTAEELVYLHQLGVPSTVLSALLTETRKTAASDVMVAAAPATVAPVNPVPVAAPTEKVEVTSNYTPLPGAPQAAQPVVNGSAVISSPAPVVVQQQPTVVYTQPAPVIVETPPVVYETRPTITFGFGFGHYGRYGYYHGGHYGRHR